MFQNYKAAYFLSFQQRKFRNTREQIQQGKKSYSFIPLKILRNCFLQKGSNRNLSTENCDRHALFIIKGARNQLFRGGARCPGGHKSNTSQQRSLAAKRADSAQGCLRRSAASRMATKKGCDLSLLLSIGEATPGALFPVLGSSAGERHGCCGESKTGLIRSRKNRSIPSMGKDRELRLLSLKKAAQGRSH